MHDEADDEHDPKITFERMVLIRLKHLEQSVASLLRYHWMMTGILALLVIVVPILLTVIEIMTRCSHGC